MSRHPYTNACDLIRYVAGHDEHGTKLSRADASKVRMLFSKVLGIDDEELAIKLSEYFIKNEELLTKAAVEAIMKSWDE